MQFLHLFSFVVVASYAAALPQPAGLSEKYSNNVDTNSAPGLEARSYQPGSNSHKDSATLVSLKRRGNSGSGSFPSSPSAPQNLVTAALLNIEKKVDSAKLEVDAVQQSFGRVFEDYKFYIKTLRPHLDKSASGQETNKYLSDGVESLVEFSLKQEALYFTVRKGVPDAVY
ncbi:hypothetical protein BASA60_004231 [Batrachochytrium salamandrivorans]|nr:hypothetical protein BASA60_004231 [Batrachochytrium salamandrivorans]